MGTAQSEKNFITLPETELRMEHTNNKGNTQVLFHNSFIETCFNTTVSFIGQSGNQLRVKPTSDFATCPSVHHDIKNQQNALHAM